MIAWITWIASAPAAAEQPLAVPLGGDPFPAQLVSLDSESVRLRSASGEETDWPLEQLVSWGRRRDFRRLPQALLLGGGVLVADVLSVEPHQLHLGADPSAFGSSQPIWLSATLPRRTVAGFILQPPDGAAPRDLLAQRIRQAAPSDELWIDEGNAVKGRIDGDLTATGGTVSAWRVRVRQRELTIDADRVQAVRLRSDSTTPLQRQEQGMLLGFADGSLARVQSLAARDGVLHLALWPSGAATVEQQRFYQELRLIRPLHPGISYLSDRQEAEFRHQPFLNIQRPLRRGASVTGGLPRWKDEVFTMSLGVSSTSFIVYDIESGWERLVSEVALDRSAGRQGAAQFRVFTQTAAEKAWSPAQQSPMIRGQDAPLRLVVPLNGARRIALVVDYGERGDVMDHANWLNARLEKSP